MLWLQYLTSLRILFLKKQIFLHHVVLSTGFLFCSLSFMIKVSLIYLVILDCLFIFKSGEIKHRLEALCWWERVV